MKYALTIAALFIVGPNVWADADICAVRPDLCDRQTTTRTQPRQAQRQQPQRRQVVQRQPRVATVRPAATVSRAKTKNCRAKGSSFSLNTADLPECNSEAAVDADDALYENVRNPLKDRIVQPAREANRSPASAIDVDAYLMANANHPAFANRSGSRQIAFEKTEKAAVMIMPSLDGGSGQREDTPTPGH